MNGEQINNDGKDNVHVTSLRARGVFLGVFLPPLSLLPYLSPICTDLGQWGTN